jgi:hypothetical protein
MYYNMVTQYRRTNQSTNNKKVAWFGVSYGWKSKNYCHVGCDTVYSGSYLIRFQRSPEMEKLAPFKTFVNICQTKRLHVPENSHFHFKSSQPIKTSWDLKRNGTVWDIRNLDKNAKEWILFNHVNQTPLKYMIIVKNNTSSRDLNVGNTTE